MTYEDLYQWAGSWGLVMLVVLFTAAVIYALWPANKQKFDDAASVPLKDFDHE
ncbi:MAG: cbb3-type cytochrome c oxidase subunit 3 [Pseudomonadota bacterium]